MSLSEDRKHYVPTSFYPNGAGCFRMAGSCCCRRPATTQGIPPHQFETLDRESRPHLFIGRLHPGYAGPNYQRRMSTGLIVVEALFGILQPTLSRRALHWLPVMPTYSR